MWNNQPSYTRYGSRTPDYNGEDRGKLTPNPYADEKLDHEMLDNLPMTATDHSMPQEPVPAATGIFNCASPSNDDVQRLRKVIGYEYDENLQQLDSMLTEASYLIKQIRVFAGANIHDHIDAICARVGVIASYQAKLDIILPGFAARVLGATHDPDSYGFAMPYVARLRTLHQPVAELSQWAQANNGKAVAYDKGEALHKPVMRIIAILRLSGWPGLEYAELDDLRVGLSVAGQVADGAHRMEGDMEVDIEVMERKLKPKSKKQYFRSTGQMLGGHPVTKF